MAELSIYTLGGLRVQQGEKVLRISQQRAQALLAHLAVERRSHPRETLASLLARSEADDQEARKQLRYALWLLRRDVGVAGEPLVTTEDMVSLAPGIWVDVAEFEALAAGGDPEGWSRAAALYRGPLLEGFHLAENLDFEDWLQQTQDRFAQQYTSLLGHLAEHCVVRGALAEAQSWVTRRLAHDPLDEASHQQLMVLHYATSDVRAALQQYEVCRTTFQRELEVSPAPETTSLTERIRQREDPLALLAQVFRAAPPPTGLSPPRPPPEAVLPPSGTLTFLFTSIENSTALWEQAPGAMPDALARHNSLLREVMVAYQGYVFKTVGDAFCVAFGTAANALAAALAAQRALLAEPWEVAGGLKVRLALYTGAAVAREGDYLGPPLNRCARLLALARGGQTLLSLATEALVRDTLPPGAQLQALGLHQLKDVPKPEQVFQLLHPDLPGDFPPLRSLAGRPTNLPALPTRLIGRAQDLAVVQRILSTTRLLTLTGSGGCGKTRLALQVATDLVETFPDGVWLVELAALTDPSLVPRTVAAALGLQEEPGRPQLETLLFALRPKKLLLVLDNCEHLVDACAHLAEALLQGCPDLRLLATSREKLGISGETTWRVPSLALPDPQLVLTLLQYGAIELFGERAAAVLPTFALTPQNAPAVIQVCQCLDGIPLAIELAAAWLDMLSVEELAKRLDDRFQLLTRGSRTALPRQQTLRATMDWSYHLLSSPEQTVLRRLAVFASGFTLEAVEAVCTGEGVAEPEVLELLARLVSKSLVEGQGREGRYRLLETVRQYAVEKFEEAGEGARVRQRHHDWYLKLAERAEPELWGPEQGTWLDRLEAEHDNSRAALEWSKLEGPEAGLRLAGALLWLWYVRGYWSEGRQWLEEMLAKTSSVSGPARTKALSALGVLAWVQGDYGRILALSKELALSQERGDTWGIGYAQLALGMVALRQGDYRRATALLEETLALLPQAERSGAGRPGAGQTLTPFQQLANSLSRIWALRGLGDVALWQGDFRRAAECYEAALALCQPLGDRRDVAQSQLALGIVALRQGKHQRATGLLEASLALYRELGDKPRIAVALHSLGAVAQAQGQLSQAAAHYQEALALCQPLGDKPSIAGVLDSLGRVAVAQGETERATGLIEASLALRRELGDQGGIVASLHSSGALAQAQGDAKRAAALYAKSLALCQTLGLKLSMAEGLEGLAEVAAAQGQPARAARLFGAAEALRQALGAPLPPAERADYDRHVAMARAGHDEAGFATAWAEGQAMPLEQAITYATQDDGSNCARL